MSRPGFYFCICPDAGLIKRHIEDLLVQYPAEVSGDAGGGLMGSSLMGGDMSALMGSSEKSASASWQKHVYWGDEELPASFWENLTLQGLFSTPKVLILRNAQAINAAQWKELSSAIAQPNPLTWLIICFEVPFEKDKPKLAAHLAKLKPLLFSDKKGWIWRHSGLDINGIRNYIISKAPKLHLTFEADALTALCASVPADATAIDSELEKLCLAADAGHVRLEMVGSGSYVPESDIFSFMKYIYAGNLSAAWAEIYRSQKDIEALLFPFLALLSRDTKILWQILAGEAVRLPSYLAREKETCARRLGYEGITKIFSCIVQAELSIKSGEKSVEQCLETLVVQLTDLFSPAQRSFS